jgi:hypothetical protein
MFFAMISSRDGVVSGAGGWPLATIDKNDRTAAAQEMVKNVRIKGDSSTAGILALSRPGVSPEPAQCEDPVELTRGLRNDPKIGLGRFPARRIPLLGFVVGN